MLSLIPRRMAAQPSAVRNAAAATAPTIHPAGEALRADTWVPPACKIFAGEMPTKYIPADDARENKASSRYRYNMASHCGSVYKPNIGMYNYGTTKAGTERGFIKQMMAEKECVKWYTRNFALVCVWLIPMIMMDHAQTNAENKAKDDPKPGHQPWYKGLFTYTFTRRYM